MSIKSLLIIHITASISLLFIGEYFFTILLQSLFFLRAFKIFLYLYTLSLNLSLILLFCSMEYGIYFLNLSVFVYCIFKSVAKISKQIVYIYFFGTLLASFAYKFLDDFFFELEMIFNIVDRVNYIDNVSLSALTILHIVIFYFVIFVGKKFDIINKK